MALLIALVILALLFGVGAVLEGLAWLALLAVVFVGIAAWYGIKRVRKIGS